MRYGSGHKDATRQRILAAAGRRMKLDGIDGSGVAALMADAGLTNGAFYAHFASKDDLVAHVVADQLRVQLDTLGELAPGREGVEQFLSWYLSADHRDAPADGCPSAALLDEIARSSDAVRAATRTACWRSPTRSSARIAQHDPTAARTTVLGVFATLIGTLQLARAVTDPSIADVILEQGAKQAIAALDLHQDGRVRVDPAVSHRRGRGSRSRWPRAVDRSESTAWSSPAVKICLRPAFTTRPVAWNVVPTAGAR